MSRWAAELTKRGYAPTPLAAGVEGAVYRLGNGSVAKVWNQRSKEEIERLTSFYSAVRRAGLPFRTPDIQEVGYLGDVFFSVERELTGAPLFPDHTGQSPPLTASRLQCVVDVLQALSEVETVDAMRQLPVLDEPTPLWDGSATFNEALGRLVEQRVESASDQVKVSFPDMEDTVRSVVEHLAKMPAVKSGLIHGDLIPANILVDDNDNVTAVLDFGFFSTVGAPAFDAVVAANIFDMYGPQCSESRTAMEHAVQDAFDYPADMLAVYLASYALATMNMFGESEEDGHFHWCAEVLRRPEVVEALASD